MKHFLVIVVVVLAISCEKNVDEPDLMQFDPFDYMHQVFSCDDTARVILDMKAYLVDKYGVGFCVGMPPGDSFAEFGDYIESYETNPEVANYVHSKYGLNDTLQVARKMRELCAIQITETEHGYLFNFGSGSCCGVATYEGILYLIEGSIEEHLTYWDSESVPC